MKALVNDCLTLEWPLGAWDFQLCDFNIFNSQGGCTSPDKPGVQSRGSPELMTPAQRAAGNCG